MMAVLVASAETFMSPGTQQLPPDSANGLFCASLPSLSALYIWKDRTNCLRLFKHAVCLPLDLAVASAGISKDARIAMMAIMSNSSIKVNALPGQPPPLPSQPGWVAGGGGRPDCCLTFNASLPSYELLAVPVTVRLRAHLAAFRCVAGRSDGYFQRDQNHRGNYDADEHERADPQIMIELTFDATPSR